MAATRKPTADSLSAYRAKRSRDTTPEPSGTIAPEDGRLFVVHKHAASHLHYDLRLEMQGVLKSWAVPKGPSNNPQDKRLAVHVEDHPVEYGDFEGIIPEGNYGAGAVIVWDRGEWIPLEDPVAGLEKGKLLFELKGYKLKGKWTLVKLKKGQKEWLFIKEKDGYVEENGEDFRQGSVLSGLTVEELRDGRDVAEQTERELVRLGARKKAVSAESVEPMHAEKREKPFSKAGWIFELKYDGYRIVAERAGGEARLLSRNGNDLTDTFPEVARAVAALPFEHIVLDGEVVVHDAQGKPSFELLQKRGRLTKAIEVRHAAVALPATYYVFDLLAFGPYDVRPLPLLERKRLLERLLPAVGAIRYSDHIEQRGEDFYEQIERMGLEGMVGKDAAAPYRGGRSPRWIKVRAERTDDFVIVGYTVPKGSRGGFGALDLAAYDGDTLIYAGRVGSGFRTSELDALREELDAIRIDAPPCQDAPASNDHRWVEPRLVAEVRYKEWTGEHLLRQPVFLRFRDDKSPEECRGESAEREAPSAKTVKPAEPAEPAVQLSNLEKVFWPAEGYTKGDLVKYYGAVAEWALTYLRDRPVVMTRYPDGIGGKSFFQKDAPVFAPDWLHTVTVWSEDAQRELKYFVADSPEALVYIANLASIPLHIWSSRVGALERPDWCILDLDPKGAPFRDVITVARALRELCNEIELPCYVKTSGSSGLHVLLPLGRQCTHEQSRTLGGLLARVIVHRVPKVATIARVISQREGKVYLDYLQNGYGKLLVAPFSVRPLPGAPVSTPLEWREVKKGLDIRRFTIKTVPTRMKRKKTDPLAGVLEDKPDLLAALERLQERL